MQDKVITCKDCGQEFTFTVGEQEFYKKKKDSKMIQLDAKLVEELRKKKQTIIMIVMSYKFNL